MKTHYLFMNLTKLKSNASFTWQVSNIEKLITMKLMIVRAISRKHFSPTAQ